MLGLQYTVYIVIQSYDSLMTVLIFIKVPTVARDIIYGWARGLVGSFFQELFAPEIFTHKAMVFGLTIWASCNSDVLVKFIYFILRKSI